MAYRYQGTAPKETRGRPRTAPDECGTLPAYARHVRAGEPIDTACRQANADYCKARRDKIKESK